jgi:RimJ/RimL family protein N-acetyltransferase
MYFSETLQPAETIKLAKSVHNPRGGKVTFCRKVASALGLRAVRFKPVLIDNQLTLRICRLRHLARLKTAVDRGHPGKAAGREIGPFRSLLAFRRWLQSTFQPVYLVEIQEYGKQRIVGMVGFYGLRAEAHLWMSLVIFDSRDRRRGYGARAVRLTCDFLQHETGIEQIFIEVAKRNHVSLSFFQACFFRREGELPRIPPGRVDNPAGALRKRKESYGRVDSHTSSPQTGPPGDSRKLAGHFDRAGVLFRTPGR